jgi:hypothetical protein
VKAKREQKAAQEAAAARSTFCEAADDYLAERIPKEKNRRKLQVMFKAELLPALGNMPLEEIARDAAHLPAHRQARRATSGP